MKPGVCCRTFLILPITVLLLTLTTYYPQTRRPDEGIRDLKGLEHFLDSLEAKYEIICGEIADANFRFYTEKGPIDQNTPKKKLASLLLDERNRNVINHWIERVKPEENSRLAYRLEIWRRVITAAQVNSSEDVYPLANELEERFSNFRYSVDGKSCPLGEATEILREKHKDDQEKQQKEIWLLKAQLSNAVKSDVRRLMKKRNQIARTLGYANYGELGLWACGIKGTWFRNMMNTFERRTHEHYENALIDGKRTSGIPDVKPWNLQHVLMSRVVDESKLPGFDIERFRNYSSEPLLWRTLSNIGFDSTTLNIKVSTSENMLYGGSCVAVHIPSDIRVVLRPGRIPLSTLLHEFGHAVCWSFVDVKEPLFKGYEVPGGCTILWAEAMANCLNLLSGNDEWLKKVRLYKDEYVQARKVEMRKLGSYRHRWRLLDIDFELSAYENIDKDLDELYRRLYRKYFLVDYPKSEPVIWASDIMLATDPVYNPNYLICHIITWQIHQTLEKKFGRDFAFDKRVVPWMIENLYQMGESIPWEERLVRATGRSLDVEGYLRSEGY
jgi:oligoendopeptidase F